MKQQTVTITTADGLNLAGLLSFPEGATKPPVVVSLHGYASTKDSSHNQARAQQFTRAGMAVLQYDMRGHGASAGNIEDANLTTGLADLAAAVEWLRRREDLDLGRIGIFGSSYGGAIALLYSEDNPIFACMALYAPASDWAASKRARLGEKEIAEWQRKGYKVFDYGVEIKSPYSFYEDIASYDAYAKAGTIKIPVLILHGDKDEAVAVDQSRRLVKEIGPNARLREFPGGDHRLTNERDFEASIAEATGFFREYLLT